MRCFIAEKPSLGKAIAAALPGSVRRDNGFLRVGDDLVTWAFGHLFEQAQPDAYGPQYKRWSYADLPIIPGLWKVNERKDAAAQVRVIRELIAQVTEVIHAGDADREGQLIIDELIEHLGCRVPVKRLWLHDLNEAGVRKAIAAMRPNSDYKGYRNSAIARARADWLLGMNGTRGYTALLRDAGGDGVMHVGRVQTPTLGLVVARDREIAAFIPVDYFNVLARFQHTQGTFIGRWQPDPQRIALDTEGRITQRAVAKRQAEAFQGGQGRVVEVKVEHKRELPPLPYSLADLQKEANAALGLSPQQVLDVAQALYETHKLTTYPRTDNTYLPESEHAQAPEVIAAVAHNFGSAYAVTFPGTPDPTLKSAAWNDTKVGAHFAIIPTGQVKSVDSLSRAELGVYTLIARRYLAQFYPAYEFDTTVVVAQIGQEVFKGFGNTPTRPGWRLLAPLDRSAKASPWAVENQTFPTMATGDPLTVIETTVDTKKTRPPPHFDGGTLIEAMQKAHLYVTDPAVKARLKSVQGIGTEATRAGIIQSLVERGYILERAKRGKAKELVHTERGALLIDIVDPALSKVDLTAWFEGLLDDVLSGALPLPAFELMQEEFVEDLVKRMTVPADRLPSSLSAAKKPCPKCGQPMKLRTGKRGQFFGCQGYPACTYTEAVTPST